MGKKMDQHSRNESSEIIIRGIRAADMVMTFTWVNDPIVRKMSFHPEPISWEEHTSWFQSKLADPHHVYYIALNRVNVPVGQIRFSIESFRADVSVLIAPVFRNKGYGAEIIALGTKQLFECTTVREVHAFIKFINTVSFKAFLKAGYKEISTKMDPDREVRHLMVERA
jgi:UDP-2,4-diacetamido-2,4,6-trideoxy-beta-L-altropyranose hydrolase